MEPFLSRRESETSRPSSGRMPKPFTNIVVSPSRADARPKVLDKAPVGTPPALPTHTYPQMWINPKPFVDKLDAKQEGAVTAKLSTAPAANESL